MKSKQMFQGMTLVCGIGFFLFVFQAITRKEEYSNDFFYGVLFIAFIGAVFNFYVALRNRRSE